MVPSPSSHALLKASTCSGLKSRRFSLVFPVGASASSVAPSIQSAMGRVLQLAAVKWSLRMENYRRGRIASIQALHEMCKRAPV